MLKKIFKKINYTLLILMMLTVNFFIPTTNVEAKTLRDLKNELETKKQEYTTSENQKRLTENEIATKKANISAINNDISNINKEMLQLTEEIEKLNEEIIIKEQQIKDIMNYYQLSNGESAYLEYIFNAADYTDFIYRMAIAEQLSDYNDKLIKEYNQIIKENEEKKVELSNKTISLNKKQEELKNQLETLRGQLSSILEESIDIKDEIELLEEYIDTYENKYKCGLDEDINTCGRDKLPPGTNFYRPLISGSVNANFGWYYPWGTASWHSGTDFGAGHGSNVYAVANGKVAAIKYRSNCGGNMIFIHHNIKGVTYTSGYFHLGSVNVSTGDVVTYNTVIGTVGGNPYIETWDSCSTGTHLHLQMAYGLYLSDYTYWSTYSSKSFDSRLVINMPGEGAWFSGRDTKY